MNEKIEPNSDELPSLLPIVALESNIILPSLIASLHVPRGKSARAIKSALKKQSTIGLVLPKKALKTKNSKSNPELSPALVYDFEDLYQLGVCVRIIKRVNMPDGSVNLLVQGLERFTAQEVIQKEPYICARVKYLKDKGTKNRELDALSRTAIQQVNELSKNNPFFTDDLKIAMVNATGPGNLADLIAFSIALKGEDAQDYLCTLDVKERLFKVLVFLKKEQSIAEVQTKLGKEVDSKLEKFQHDFFLKEQLKSIKKELGLEEDDKSRETKELRTRLEEADLPENVYKLAKEEIERLKLIPDVSPEFNLSRSYVDWILSLPWSKSTKDNLNINRARKILDEEHFGLEKVKDRILEFLAVRKLKPDYEGAILCFLGPPGVGKTSLGKAIAKTLGREFFRFSLGGMRDEAEIKGHRRTYVGAMPGKILQGIKRVGSNNAVVLLDEVDKVGASFQGDPASALLEVLDPEQNSNFLDHYLDIPFDLSKVMFIATANDMSTVPSALRDRMEVIQLPGYTMEEKENIAKNYVIPKSLVKHGLKKKDLKIPVTTLRKLIEDYAREPGVRSLQQQTDKLSRGVARKLAEGRRNTPSIQKKDLRKLLGPKLYYNEVASRVEQAGVMTGLAWTSLGGEILFIEAIALPGKGNLELTGQMGEVMLESAKIALSHVQKYLSSNGIQLKAVEKNLKSGKHEMLSAMDWFKKHDIHLHIPAGAVPKDGPSAGITMAATFLSLVTGQKAKNLMAMTGELSLVGKVLPVGGVREKVLAAKRAGIKHIVLPKLNERDLEEIPKEHSKGLSFSFADRVDEVFEQVIRR